MNLDFHYWNLSLVFSRHQPSCSIVRSEISATVWEILSMCGPQRCDIAASTAVSNPVLPSIVTVDIHVHTQEKRRWQQAFLVTHCSLSPRCQQVNVWKASKAKLDELLSKTASAELGVWSHVRLQLDVVFTTYTTSLISQMMARISSIWWRGHKSKDDVGPAHLWAEDIPQSSVEKATDIDLWIWPAACRQPLSHRLQLHAQLFDRSSWRRGDRESPTWWLRIFLFHPSLRWLAHGRSFRALGLDWKNVDNLVAFSSNPCCNFLALHTGGLRHWERPFRVRSPWAWGLPDRFGPKTSGKAFETPRVRSLDTLSEMSKRPKCEGFAATFLDVLLKSRLNDCWNVDGDCQLSETWTGFTQFTI